MIRHFLTAGNGRFFSLLLLPILLLLVMAEQAGPTSAQEPILPPVTPDAETGLSLFAERCIACHGPAGQGNGEMADRLPKPPADYTDPDFLKTRIPADMYTTITNGILESGMPPFGPESSNTISEENRWHLVAAVYSLGTPAESIEAGQAIYEENCLACHGDTGAGDGADAAGSETEPTDLTNVRYWFNRSNETVFTALENSGIPDHDYTLSDEERWNVVDYARTFSYAYVNPSAPVEPIEGAVISGVVLNGTTGELVEEADVLLRGFDQSFQQTVTMSTTVGTDGRYTFNLDPVQPDWVYLASARYNELGFSSDAGQISRAEPALELPITVYEPTTDPGVVNLEQVHILLSFGEDRVLADEFYVFGNNETAVFVGEDGDPEAGTVRFSLPEGAENVSFQRSFGSMNSSIPATEVIQLEEGVYADTFPLNPGGNALNMIVSYDLPYKDGMEVARPLFYDAANVSVIIPGQGVTLSGEDWVDEGVQEMPGGGGSFNSYSLAGVPAGSDLAFEINGRPQTITDAAGNAIPAQNSASDLIVGGAVLLIVIIASVFIITRRDAGEEYDDEEAELEEAEIDRLLAKIVDLDDARDAGTIDDETYRPQRQKLISELAAIWPVDEE
jgi:mono/diheme cytochrome c family protein